jgi:cation transport protein ChaC
VLGLIGGGSCAGRVYRVSGRRRARTIAKLFRREMLTGVYRPMWHRVRTPKGYVKALAFVARRDHKQFAGKISMSRAAAVLSRCEGDRGPGRDYLANTVRHLDELGIGDGPLHRLHQAVEARCRRAGK